MAGSGVLATCPTTAVTPTPLRRLTKFEYANTVRNLLNVDVDARANDLPADEVTDGFNNNAGILTVSPLHAEKYVLVSEALAKEAVKNLAALTGNCNTTTPRRGRLRDGLRDQLRAARVPPADDRRGPRRS